MAQDFSIHYEKSGILNLSTEEAFIYLDDHNKLSSHMDKSSWMMMGSRMLDKIVSQLFSDPIFLGYSPNALPFIIEASSFDTRR